MFEKLKTNFTAVLGLLLALVTGAFLFERSRRQSADAIADNKEDLDKLAELDREKAANSGKLDSEAAKREDIRKDVDDAKADDSDDASNFLRKR